MKAKTDRLTVLLNNSGASWGGVFSPLSSCLHFMSFGERFTNGCTIVAPYDDFPENGWDKLMALNVKSIFYGMAHSLQVREGKKKNLTNNTRKVTVGLDALLRKGATHQHPSRVINVASMAGIMTSDVTAPAEGGLSAPGHGTFSCTCPSPFLTIPPIHELI